MQRADVIDRLGRGGQIVELTAALLRFCRDHHDALRARLWVAADQRRHAAIVARAAAILAPIGSLATADGPAGQWTPTESIDVAVGRALAALVDDAVAVHAIATALDDHAHAAFFGRFDDVRTRLRAGDPFPVPAPEAARDLFGPHLTAHPDRQDDRVDHTAHLRLLAAEHGFYVVLDGRVRLPPPAAGRLIAVAVPSAALPIDASHTWTTDAAARRFRDVGPADPEAQWQRILALLIRAEHHGAWAVVLPELAVTAAIALRIDAWLGGARRVALIAAGSYHASVEDRHRRNLAPIFARDRRARSHAKIYPFEQHGQTEDIRPGRRVTVWATRRWSFTAVICRDLLSSRVVPLLEDLRVRLVLAPAFSPRTAELEAVARYLAVRTQGAVVVANTPHAEGDPVAWMAQPLAVTDAPVPRRDDRPHLVFFTLGQTSWIYGKNE
jgi:predicted amidohydrolase